MFALDALGTPSALADCTNALMALANPAYLSAKDEFAGSELGIGGSVGCTGTLLETSAVPRNAS